MEFHPTFNLDLNGSLREVGIYGHTAATMDAMIGYISDKYGPPLIDRSEVQNKIGNRFPTTTATWIDSRGTQIVIRAGGENGKVDGASFTIRSATKQAEYVKWQLEQLQHARDNL